MNPGSWRCGQTLQVASLGVREGGMGHDLIIRGHSGPGTDYWCWYYFDIKINWCCETLGEVSSLRFNFLHYKAKRVASNELNQAISKALEALNTWKKTVSTNLCWKVFQHVREQELYQRVWSLVSPNIVHDPLSLCILLEPRQFIHLSDNDCESSLFNWCRKQTVNC